MLVTVALVGLTAAGTWWIYAAKSYRQGLDDGFSFSVQQLIAKGFIEVEYDAEGDEVLISIENVKKGARGDCVEEVL
jgi:hypothetical protein